MVFDKRQTNIAKQIAVILTVYIYKFQKSRY